MVDGVGWGHDKYNTFSLFPQALPVTLAGRASLFSSAVPSAQLSPAAALLVPALAGCLQADQTLLRCLCR